MSLATTAAVVGIAGSAYGIYNSSKSRGGGSAYQYIPQGSGQADTDWQALLAQMQTDSAGVNAIPPYLQDVFRQQEQLPYSGYQQAANQASSMYPGIAGADINIAQLLAQMGGAQAGAGNQILQNSMDPQHALYDRTVQQLQDQQRAANSASGVGTTPYGAGLEGQTLGNFNIDWQNRQLGREATGIQGAANAFSQSGQDYSGSLQALGQAPQNLLQGGYLPVQVGQNIGQMQTGAANQYAQGIGNALSPLAGIQSQIIPYLNAGQGAGANAFNQYANNRNFDALQQQQATQGLIQGLNAYSRSGGGGGGFSGYGAPTNSGQTSYDSGFGGGGNYSYT